MSSRFEELRATDLGTVEAVGEPEGVAWVSFNGLALTDYAPTGAGLCTVPVAAQDLTRNEEQTPEVGDQYWASINLAATSMADVDPVNFEYNSPENGEEY